MPSGVQRSAAASACAKAGWRRAAMMNSGLTVQTWREKGEENGEE